MSINNIRLISISQWPPENVKLPPTFSAYNLSEENMHPLHSISISIKSVSYNLFYSYITISIATYIIITITFIGIF